MCCARYNTVAGNLIGLFSDIFIDCFYFLASLLARVGRLFYFNRMNYKDQMKKWLAEHPDATAEQIWEAGYHQCTENWLHGKVELMEKCMNLMKQIIQ